MKRYFSPVDGGQPAKAAKLSCVSHDTPPEGFCAKKKKESLQLNETSSVDVFTIPSHIALTPEEFDSLWAVHPEEHGKVKIYGKVLDVPRWQQAFGHSYKFSGLDHKAEPMTPLLQRLLDWCKADSPSLNGCLVNWYENGEHYIGPHSDDESLLIKGSPIYSLSFGATRTFSLHDIGTGRVVQQIPLASNTLVVMRGETQKFFKHSVPKTKKIAGKRINVTFRSFVN